MSDVIYLDNASTSWPKPRGVVESMQRFQAEDAGNPGRSGHRMSVSAERMLDRVRKGLTELVSGLDGDPTRMIFTLNGTDALNIAIKGVLEAEIVNRKKKRIGGGLARWAGVGRGKRGLPHVITSTLEHNSVSRSLQALADRGKISLTRVGFSPSSCTIDPADIQKAITPLTRLVVLTHASNVTGTIQPVGEVGRITREHGLLFLVDAAQTIGSVPIDVETLGIDLLAFPGHKGLLGPTGTGGLYVAPTVALEKMLPFREGGSGGDSAYPTMPPVWPYYLEGGTPNIVGLAGLEAALDYLKQRGLMDILNHERHLTYHLMEALGSGNDRRFTIHGVHSPAERVGTLSLTLSSEGGEPIAPEEVGSILDDSFDTAVRTGLHCAPYTHQGLGTFPQGTVRISPGAFNTLDQINGLVEALHQIIVM